MGALTTQQIRDFRNQPAIKAFYKFVWTSGLREKALARLNDDLEMDTPPLAHKGDEATYEDVEAIA